MSTLQSLIDPPKYSEIPSRAREPGPTKSCGYCKAEVAKSVYNDHLAGAHGKMVFRCENCNNYIDRKLFLKHMSDHAIVLTKSNENTTKFPDNMIAKSCLNVDINQNTKPPPKYSTPATRSRIILRNRKETPNELPDQRNTNCATTSSQLQPNVEMDQSAESNIVVDPKVKQEKENDTKAAGKPKWSRSCPICSKTYTVSSSFFYHLKHSHATSKEHECDVCGKKFASRATLAQHGATHSDELKFACTVCDKRFKSRASLYIHSQTHGRGAAPAPHACATCGRGFRWRAALARHVARHEGARAHACAACPRAFSVRGDLARHARTHRAAELACAHCGQKFAQQRYLNVHLAKKHNKRTNK